MTTKIRPELSVKNKYWINRHRYYELKHFCLQYPIWKQLYSELDGLNRHNDADINREKGTISDPVENCAEKRIFFADRMEMIEKAAKDTCPELSDYILAAVTKGISYDCLKLRMNIPCCKDVYYDLYRRFFWLLDKARG